MRNLQDFQISQISFIRVIEPLHYINVCIAYRLKLIRWEICLITTPVTQIDKTSI